jgi:ABC-2 type transport system permease protein
MRKIFVIALREYNAAVRTKAFIISLIIMPVMMGGSVVVQWLLKDFRDIKDKRFVVIDRTEGERYLRVVKNEIDEHNKKVKANGQQTKPVLVLVEEKAPKPEQLEDLRAELSERVRAGKLVGFLEIGPRIETGPRDKQDEGASLRYQTNRPMDKEIVGLAMKAITKKVEEQRSKDAKLDLKKVRKVVAAVPLVEKGLSKRDADGIVKDATEQNRLAPILVPMVLMILMFMMIMLGSTPLMQGVVEEKMQRIAEVLLGSVQPFPLMLGKILGMTGVSLTIAAVYLGGAYWAARRFDVSEYVPVSLLLWFVLFQALASLMYGSLFIAVGAACTDMKETQNLLWPIMLLATLPMFVLGNVLQEPNS